VSFSVLFAPGLGIRARQRARVTSVLRDIARAFERIPEGSPYWTAVKGGIAELNLGAWRFEYCVDVEARRIVIVGAYRDGEGASVPGAHGATKKR
jgi:hypothetical protein